MLPEIPEDQVRDAVEEIAREILAEGDVLCPPVDVDLLAERLGILVARDGPSDIRARFVRLGSAGGHSQDTIMVADDPRPERRQWAVAHEIGESQAWRVFTELGVGLAEAAPAAREAVANCLAGCLLLPREWFAADGAELDWDLYNLKAIYDTASHEMIARRMLEMPPPVIITLTDHDRQTWRRANRRLHAPPMTPPEITAWKAAHALGQAAQCNPADLPEGIEDIRAWPIHEPAWKREIIRTALSDDC